MEANCLWVKNIGVTVLERVIFGYSFFGRPEDYMYDSVVIDYNKQIMRVYDGPNVYVMYSDDKLVVPDVFVMWFVDQQLSHKSSTNIYEMIKLMTNFFNRKCTKTMTEIAISEIQMHRKNILDPLENWIPATIIQRAWKRCISDPNYTQCRNRLMTEFNSM